MPRMPLNDECRRSLLRRLWVPVRPYFATASDAPHSYGYLDRSSARNRLRIMGATETFGSFGPVISGAAATTLELIGGSAKVVSRTATLIDGAELDDSRRCPTQ